MTTTLTERDLQTVWHPCSQMKDYERFPPITIQSAEGSYLYDDTGRPIIDAISSWWCKSLGHKNQRLQQAMVRQSEQMEHHIIANTTNETLVQCSEAILSISPNHDKVFYASDGSCAVEIALKMAVHAQQLMGYPERSQFMALKNGYHGETALTLSVSDLGLYKDPYRSLMLPVPYIDPCVLTTGPSDPNWNQPIDNQTWKKIQEELDKHAKTTAAFVLEPIVQGAGGMLIYHPDVLRRLREYTRENNILLIADEIMTGIGRTGTMLACEHATIEADLVCLSKGLTGGYMPFSATLVPNSIYDLFYDDYETGKAFLHSHTYTGHTLAAAVALETLRFVKEENITKKAQEKGKILYQGLNAIREETGLLGPVRQVGCLAAAELIGDANFPRAGYAVYQEAVKRGALLRPLGNTIVWIPPITTSNDTLSDLKEITQLAIEACTKKRHN